MPPAARTAPCGKAEARVRLRTGLAYLEVAELVMAEHKREEFLNVAAGLSVLAGIAASDTICCTRIGRRHRGEDHRGAAGLLSEAVPDGKALAAKLIRLLDIKDQAQYGVIVVAPRRARDAVKWARHLLERATEEVNR
ncbi:MAG: hypothetical protein M3256_15295 [Actinomycetota bacterium]|nr:hypothetical protein [Actinomycetota bacterium]